MALKIGIIGNGGIAHAHGDGYKALGDRVELVACCDIDFEKAKSYAGEYDIPDYYASCDEMLAAHPELDAVSVCTWNSAHAECTIKALNAGCNVLCEKPMALNAKEAEAMREAAVKNGKLLMLGFVRRHGSDAQKAKELVFNGELGDVYFAKASYLRRCGFPGGWFGDKSRSGGGPLIDLGVHVIDLVKYICGNPKPVSVYGVTFDKLGARDHIETTEWKSQTKVDKPIFDVEDLALAIIRFDNGLVLHVEASFNLNIKKGSGDVDIFGDKAGLSLSPFELHTEYANQIADITLAGEDDFDFSRDFKREIRNFVDAVSGKADCIATADDGVELMQIIDAVYESAVTGKAVVIK